jgi:transcriptional regulator with XRE-family HTH domain
MARPSSPTVSRRELANTLRLLRQRAGRTLDEAAGALEVSAATLSRIETAVRVPRARDVKDLCEFYGITDPARISNLTSLVADAKESGWWESYSEVNDDYATFIGFETAATAIDQFEGMVVPTILQTNRYADAFLRGSTNPSRTRPFSDHDIAKRGEIRTRRQQILAPNGGPAFTLVIDEGALLRPIGGAEVMREQLRHLITAAERPGTDIQILPFDRGAHPGLQGIFSILTLPQEQVSDVVYIDSLAGQLFIETPTEITRYRKVFTTLRQAALDTEASIAALHNRIALL